MRGRLAIYYRHLALYGCRHWYDYLLMTVLIPCGYIYAFAGLIRAWLYRRGVLSSSRAHVPVISVGNLVVGGTGKTPVVGWIITFLHRQGLRAAVISRGYASSPPPGTDGRARKVDVNAAGGVAQAAKSYGDEPVLLALRHPDAVVIVARQRMEGVRYLQQHHDIDVIILDDAFQHLTLQRDLDLVLLDARHPFGNGYVLPAGLMREPRSALRRADMLLMTRYRPDGNSHDPAEVPALHIEYHLASYALDLHGNRIALNDLCHLKLGAFAGIADPDDFFASLRRYGIHPLAVVPLADHTQYTRERIHHIMRRCAEAQALITTEKDAVKLDSGIFPLPCYYVPLEIEPVEQAHLEQAILNIVSVSG
jgi:tetraacyldisaccharide 4'-kinase